MRLRPVRRLEFRDVADDDEVVPPGGFEHAARQVVGVLDDDEPRGVRGCGRAGRCRSRKGRGAAGAVRPDRSPVSAAWAERYGTETLVLSPELVMVKVPADATGV